MEALWIVSFTVLLVLANAVPSSQGECACVERVFVSERISVLSILVGLLLGNCKVLLVRHIDTRSHDFTQVRLFQASTARANTSRRAVTKMK